MPGLAARGGNVRPARLWPFLGWGWGGVPVMIGRTGRGAWPWREVPEIGIVGGPSGGGPMAGAAAGGVPALDRAADRFPRSERRSCRLEGACRQPFASAAWPPARDGPDRNAAGRSATDGIVAIARAGGWASRESQSAGGARSSRQARNGDACVAGESVA